jgi:acyl-CoA reductase-like NAD-dependent aldehyde dehydrogenase
MVLVFLVLAAAMTFVVIKGAQKAFSMGWQEAARPLLIDYVDRLTEKITADGVPNVTHAQAIASRLPLTVRIEGPQVNWASHPDQDVPDWQRKGRAEERRLQQEDWGGGKDWQRILKRTTADGHSIEFGINEEVFERRPRLIGFALTALLLLTLLAWLYVRRLLKPLDAIGEGARRFGAGNFSQPISERHLHGPDELGELAHTINTMGQDIHQMLEAKRALLLAISHELRSPLTRARLNTELLPETAQVNPQRDALLRDLQGAKSVGVIAEDPAKGLVEIARPVGVVCAVTPSTNPGATPANKIINALKGRNAVIVAPSPKGWSTCERLLQFIHAEFDRIGAPRDLVQMLPQPVDKASTLALMRQCDLVVATGSQANVRAAYASGTPAFGVGAGNVAGIVDETADLALVADRVRRSKTFDNATSCSSENSLVLLDSVYDAAVQTLKGQGAVLLSVQQKAQLQALMWPDGKLSSAATGQNATVVAQRAGLPEVAALQPSMLLVEESGFGPKHPFSGEKLSVVMALYRVKDIDDAIKRYYGIGAATIQELEEDREGEITTLDVDRGTGTCLLRRASDATRANGTARGAAGAAASALRTGAS